MTLNDTRIQLLLMKLLKHKLFIEIPCQLTFLLKICLDIVPMVSFEQPTYSVNEDDGQAQPVLVLSNPSLLEFTVEVSTTDNTATGECNSCE